MPGLIVALRRLGVVRWRHVRPSGVFVHRPGPLLRRLDHAGVRVGRGGPRPWQRCPSRWPLSVARPRRLSSSRRLRLPSVAVVVASKEEEYVQTMYMRRLSILPRLHGLIVVLLPDNQTQQFQRLRKERGSLTSPSPSPSSSLPQRQPGLYCLCHPHGLIVVLGDQTGPSSTYSLTIRHGH